MSYVCPVQPSMTSPCPPSLLPPPVSFNTADGIYDLALSSFLAATTRLLQHCLWHLWPRLILLPCCHHSSPSTPPMASTTSSRPPSPLPPLLQHRRRQYCGISRSVFFLLKYYMLQILFNDRDLYRFLSGESIREFSTELTSSLAANPTSPFAFLRHHSG